MSTITQAVGLFYKHGNLATAGAILLLAIFWISHKLLHSYRERQGENTIKSKHNGVYDNIEPLRGFEWKTAPPIRLRPFKPLYHLTMSITNSLISELIEMDQTYLERIKLRRKVVRTNEDSVLACNPVAASAVLELHEWMFGCYLPTRFPELFTLVQDGGAHRTWLQNNITNERVSLIETDPVAALQALNAHVDTDFIFLLPSSISSDGQPLYHEEAFIATFPNGFSFKSKLSLPLATIHTPVPGYAAKLERSMDRYFARLAIGTVVKRANWSITTHSRLFAESGNHFYREDEVVQDVEESPELERRRHAYQQKVQALRDEVDINDCRLRCERQTLHRLPKSGAIVFGIKTYQYTLQDVKAAGDGPALADAIDGLGKGNVPEMLYYKRGIIWGDKVVEYLRSAA